jgi:hypothetical protein
MQEKKEKKPVQKAIKLNRDVEKANLNLIAELKNLGFTYNDYLKNPNKLVNIMKRVLMPVYINELEKERL